MQVTVLLSIHGASIFLSDVTELPAEYKESAERVAKSQFEIASFLKKQSLQDKQMLVMYEQFETEWHVPNSVSHSRISSAFPQGLPEQYSLLSANQKRILQRESQMFAVRYGIIPVVHGNFFDDPGENRKLANKYARDMQIVTHGENFTKKQLYSLLSNQFEREFITIKRAVALAQQKRKEQVYVIFGAYHKNGFERVIEHCSKQFPDININFAPTTIPNKDTGYDNEFPYANECERLNLFANNTVLAPFNNPLAQTQGEIGLGNEASYFNLLQIGSLALLLLYLCKIFKPNHTKEDIGFRLSRWN